MPTDREKEVFRAMDAANRAKASRDTVVAFAVGIPLVVLIVLAIALYVYMEANG